MPRMPATPDSDGNSEESRKGKRRRKGGPAETDYMPFTGRGGALLSPLFENMREETSLPGEEPKPARRDKGRDADIAFIRNAFDRLGHATAALFRPLTVRLLIWLDRLLTDPAERKGPPPSRP